MARLPHCFLPPPAPGAAASATVGSRGSCLPRFAAVGGARACGTAAPPAPPTGSAGETKFYRERLLDGEEEVLTEAEKIEKDQIVKELTRRLSGPLADEHGNVPTGKDRPIAIEVDGPSHFYANSRRYTAYTKLKHRLLTRMGYKVLHVPYYDWRRLRGAKEREGYMRAKLVEEPTEWLDPEDEKYYNQPPEEGEAEFSVAERPGTGQAQAAPAAPATPQAPPQRAARDSSASAASEARGRPQLPPRPPPPPPAAAALGGAAPPASPPPDAPPASPPPPRPPAAPGADVLGAAALPSPPFPPPPPRR